MPILKRKHILEGRHVEDPVVRYAKETYGITALKLSIRGHNSWPDRVFLFPKPWLLFIEFKRPGEEPTDNQRDTHIIIEGLGYDIYVVDNKEEGCRLIDVQAKAARVAAKGISKESDAVRARTKRRRALPRSGPR